MKKIWDVLKELDLWEDWDKSSNLSENHDEILYSLETVKN